MQQPAIRAGVSRADVTPPPGMYLVGYGDRSGGAISVHDRLTATVLALDDGQQQAAIIALDILGLNWSVVQRVMKTINERTGIPSHHVFICCSHTHSGPVGYAPERLALRHLLQQARNRFMLIPTGTQPRGVRFNRLYIDQLVEQLATTTGEAHARLAPVTLLAGRGESHIGHNRRERQPDGTVRIGHNPNGPIDRSVTVVQARDEEEQPLATLVNFACHPTIIGPNSYAVSADWVGVMRAHVEQHLGGLCLFIQGAAGDINPQMEWSADDWPEVQQKGAAVGAEVVRVARSGMALITGTPLRVAVGSVEMPLQASPSAAGSAIYRQRIHELGKTDPEIPSIPLPFIEPVLQTRYPWHTHVEKVHDGLTTPVPVGALRAGDLVLATLAMEPFTETGLAVKAASTAPVTLFAGYTNGLTGYLPTAEEHALGGYEVELAPYFYRLPGVLAPGAEQQVVEEMIYLVQEVCA